MTKVLFSDLKLITLHMLQLKKERMDEIAVICGLVTLSVSEVLMGYNVYLGDYDTLITVCVRALSAIAALIVIIPRVRAFFKKDGKPK